MNINFKYSSFGLLLISGLNFLIAQNQPKDSVQDIGELLIKSQSLLGSKYEAQNRTGSASYLSKADLERFGYTNMNNILLTVPGVNLYEEDGFGLRPNISLRGTSPERSAKITLMEDGVIIAPAPYSSPAAYYSPNIARMSAVEVLKGSSQVQYGPFTTGGAINFVSNQIPDTIAASGKVIWGNYNTRQVHANFGERKDQFGYFVEYLDYNSDGFKSLQNGGDTGFDRKDFMGKFMVNTKADAKVFQSLTLKLQYAEEESDETYLGLTDQDFRRDPFKRYLASAEDVMTTEHDQVALTHILKMGDNFKLTTTAYHNNFKRNWYKLNDVMNGADKIAIADIINNPEDFSLAFDAISSGNDTEDDVFIVRANNRSYFSRGIQTKGNYSWGNGIF
ncbi:MAG: TonB-dependent receptor plug domain-containing protein, partial [Flavobacteriaceae bacterium]|nr:TonB-dependent receptor plug domain-containing protein [Flavobacteriaceae bacterium]